MEYVFASLILHYAKKPITEENIRKILNAAEINVDEARIKALVATLNEVDIDEIIKSAATLPTAVPTAVQPAKVVEEEEKKEEKAEEEEKKEEKAEEESMEGLAALFG